MIDLIGSAQRMGGGRSTELIEDNGAFEDQRSPRNDDTTKELSKDQTFDILRNSRRRAVLSCLRARGGELSVKEVSTYVAAEEYGIPAAELSPEQYKRVYNGLYQCHLGRMEELGVIDFDTDQNTIRLHDVASQIEPYLDSGTNRGTVRVELAVALAVTAIVALGATGPGSIHTLSPISLAAVTVAALLGLALFNYSAGMS